MAPRHLDFYFDYLSGYAWFAWMRIRGLCKTSGVELRIHPVVFGKLLDHWGQLGPAEIPSKKAFVYRHGMRLAAAEGVSFNPPASHPFNPLTALRVSLKEVAGETQAEVVQAIFEAGWTRGAELGEPNSLAAILTDAGLDGHALVARTSEPKIKQRLKDETEAAVSQGVFGVPTMIVEGELFWGADQLPFIEAVLAGNDSLDGTQLDSARLDALLARPRGIDRSR